MCRLIRRQNDAFHILNIPPPNLHGFSDHARVRSQIRSSRTFLQSLDIQPLIIRRPHFVPHDEKPSFEARNMPFRSPFSYLSHLESLAIATRKMPNATGGSPFSAFRPFRFAFSRAISAKNATQVFYQFFLLLVVECGVGMGLLNFENSTNGIMEKPQMV